MIEYENREYWLGFPDLDSFNFLRQIREMLEDNKPCLYLLGIVPAFSDSDLVSTTEVIHLNLARWV